MKTSAKTCDLSFYFYLIASVLATAGSALDEAKEVREVMQVSRDQSQIEGRWFWGAGPMLATGGSDGMAAEELN